MKGVFQREKCEQTLCTFRDIKIQELCIMYLVMYMLLHHCGGLLLVYMLQHLGAYIPQQSKKGVIKYLLPHHLNTFDECI